MAAWRREKWASALREANREQGRRIAGLLSEHRKAGAFKELAPDDCFTSVVIGPSQDYARHWLAGRTRVALIDCRDQLAQIAWESVRA